MGAPGHMKPSIVYRQPRSGPYVAATDSACGRYFASHAS